MQCAICDTESPRWAWTDHHGIAQCVECGAPYRLIHYEGDARVEKPPEFQLSRDVKKLAKLRRFYSDTKARLSAVGMQFSFPGGYDIATRADIEAWNNWHDKSSLGDREES